MDEGEPPGRPASNPTSRAVAVFDRLARSERPLGLSELSTATGMAKSTCLAVLRAGLDVGWVAFDEVSRAYAIGPAMVGTALAVVRRTGEWGPARPLLTELALALDGACSVMVPLQDQLVTTARSVDPDPVSRFVPTGHRVVLAPPFGAAALLRASPSMFERWLRRADPPVSDAEERALRRAVRGGAKQGWIATTMTGATRSARRRLAEMRRADSPEAYLATSRRLAGELRTTYLLEPVPARSRASIASIAAPIDHPGSGPRPVLVVDQHGIDLTGRALGERAERVVHVAARLAEACPSADRTFD